MVTYIQLRKHHYLNSDDWAESMSEIVENEKDEIELIDYPTFLHRQVKT
ncbi:MAG: hypothetical protein O3C43_08785 [Verrucomicrobia bacterium]|nr:hypothetical protein [Verrucomicrobiota bacterium]MDA1066583.1 hypothetical protein [Verrucomicrobiota bacterium]